MLAGMIDSDYQGETVLLCNGGKEEYAWNTGNPLVHLSTVMLSTMEKANNPFQTGLLMAWTLQE